MGYVVAAPEILSVAASDLANIGSMLQAANAAATTPTVSVLSAAATRYRKPLRSCLAPTPVTTRPSAHRRLGFTPSLFRP